MNFRSIEAVRQLPPIRTLQKQSVELWDAWAQRLGARAVGYYKWDNASLRQQTEQGWSLLCPHLLNDHFGGDTLILVFGCGTGRFARRMMEQDHQVVGLDISRALITLARSQTQPGLNLVQIAPGETLTFAENTFDVLWTYTVLQHIADSLFPSVVQELKRVLQPQAMLVLFENTEPHKDRESRSGHMIFRGLDEYFSRLFGISGGICKCRVKARLDSTTCAVNPANSGRPPFLSLSRNKDCEFVYNIWQGTPFSIARAAQQGHSITLMFSVLTRLMDEPLSTQRQTELVNWYQRHNTYRIHGGYVLSVKQPTQLDEIMGQQRWRPHIGERLSPRHALVSPSLTPLLARRLQMAGYPLDTPWPPAKSSTLNGASGIDPATHYLALEVLHGLGKIIQLPFSVPIGGTGKAKEQLSLAQLADVELKIKQVLDGIREAIRGRDAYFLPEDKPDSALVKGIESAIAHEKVLEIAYQALGESVPRLRRVEPHWLERRAAGLYLHGYCYLAEANRVFRLDRIHQWKIPDEIS